MATSTCQLSLDSRRAPVAQRQRPWSQTPSSVGSNPTRGTQSNAGENVTAPRHDLVMHPVELRATARALHGDLGSLSEVAHRLGLPRQTVASWIESPRGHEIQPAFRRLPCCDGNPQIEDEEAFAHLLGLYLGDGYLIAQKQSYLLRIYCDPKYPNLAAAAESSIDSVAPGKRKSTRTESGCLIVTARWRHWACLFPQHGPGMKHTRVIELSAWQRSIVQRNPKEFLRGLIHSDGCRVVNRVRRSTAAGERVHEYPRYFFTNNSDDILGLCGWALDLLEIPWRRNRWNCLSVARREGVRRLDEFVGPKS